MQDEPNDLLAQITSSIVARMYRIMLRIPSEEDFDKESIEDSVENLHEDSVEDFVEDSVENLHEDSDENFFRRYLEDPLEAAQTIIEKWEKAIEDDPERLFLLNEAQCTKMWQNCRRVYNAFEPSSTYPREYKQKFRDIFIEFHSIVERGGAVMDMCTKVEAERGGAVQNMGNEQVSWLKAAILYGDNERMFQELSDNLQFCVDCACKLTKSLSFPSSRNKPLNHVDVALLPSQARVEFKRDFARLKEKLEGLVKEHVGSENAEVHLAQYFLDRDTFRSKPTQARQDPSPSKATCSEKYFEKNRHYPKKGDDHKAGGGGSVGCPVTWLGLKCFKKIFDKDGFDEENLKKFMANFQKEVNVLERLNHCNIVRLLCSQSAKPSIVMEFGEMDLHKFLIKRKKQINLVAAVDMMLQMALGMEYSHEQGVVHRDLKSSNILVCPSRHPSLEELGYVEVKVTDFGIAKVNELIAPKPTYNMMGTTGWRAPEVEKGHTIDWRLADTYSFAITCAEILTLPTPPTRASGQRPVLLGDCPNYFRELLERCWDENPKKRPFFKDIVWELKNLKMHLLLGTSPKRNSLPYLFTMRLLQLREYFKLQKFKTKDLSTLTMEWAESGVFKATVASIEKRLELAGSVVNNMIKRHREVIICPTQCGHLVDECKSGLKQVTLAYYNMDPKMMVDLFLSKDKNLQGLARSLDGLICSLIATEELLGSCTAAAPDKWKLMAISLCAPPPLQQACSRFGYCLWELYWSLYVTRSHLDGTFSHERCPLILTSMSFKWSNESCKFVVVAKSIVTRTGDVEIQNLEADTEEEFVKADGERQIKDRKLLLLELQNSTHESPPVYHWHVIGMYLESLCASIWKVPSTKFDNGSLSLKLGAVLRRRLESKCMGLVHERRSHLLRTSATAFYDLNNQNLEYNFSPWWEYWCECWSWGVQMMCKRYRGEIFEEIKLLAIVQHPNIANLIGFQGESESEVEGREAKSPCIIFEPMTTTLDYLIDINKAFYSGSSPFSFLVTLDILLQIVEAMIHMHKCGVVYLNLQPQNILVKPKITIDRYGTSDLDLDLYYNVKLARFQRAILVNPNGPVGADDSFLGAYDGGRCDYIAPEIFVRGQRTKFVDVWGFGMTAYHIVSGSFPFVSMDILDMMSHFEEVRHGERQLPLPFGATFPRGLKTLIQKCCVIDPFARISFEEIRKELWILKRNYDIDGLQE